MYLFSFFFCRASLTYIKGVIKTVRTLKVKRLSQSLITLWSITLITFLRRGGRWHQIITTPLAPSVIPQRDPPREMRYLRLSVCVCARVCVQRKAMDQQDGVSRRISADFHPRCCFDYFRRSPVIFGLYSFTKGVSVWQRCNYFHRVKWTWL